MLQDNEGNIWVGTLSGGITRYDGKTWQVFPSISYQMSDNSIAAITHDLQGNLWFITTNYAARYDGDSWVSFDLRIGVTKTNVPATGITVDKSGNVWVSTDNNGVLRYDGKNWRVYTVSDGLISNDVSHIFQDSSGRLWCSDAQKGIETFDGQKWTTFVRDGLEYIRSIVEDHSGNLWFGTDGAGITRYDGTAWTSFTTAEGLPDDTVYRLLIDARGNLWDASANGLNVLKGQTWQTVVSYTQIALGSNNAAVGEDGSLWFGGANGVTHYVP
jgi:ligand-binding sensor domain-containing protein